MMGQGPNGKPIVSILIPVFNEQENIRRAYDAIVSVFDTLPDYRFEIVFTDNHSTDGSFMLLRQIAAEDARIRVLRFSRNYGYQRSVLVGYQNARGVCAIQIDCDLQDPPELIPEMLRQWRRGNAVVYGVRTSLPDGWLTALSRRVFYRTMRSISHDDLPLNAGEFRLVDRRLIDELRDIRDPAPYVRGLVSAMGFQQVGVPYARAARIAGRSKFPLRAMLGMGLDGLLNHSLVPLRLASYVGLAVAGIMLLLLIAYLAAKLVFGQDWPAGFATTTMLMLLSITLNSLFLGVIGEYLGRIFQQLKQPSLPIIEVTLNGAIPGYGEPADDRTLALPADAS